MRFNWNKTFGWVWLAATIFVVTSVAASPVKLLSATHKYGFNVENRTFSTGVVTEVEPAGSADKAGLKVGDLLPQESMRSLVLWLPPSEPPLTIKVIRGDGTVNATLPLDIDPIPTSLKVSRLAIKITAFTCFLAAFLIGLVGKVGSAYRWLAAAFLALGTTWGTYPGPPLGVVVLVLDQMLFPVALFCFFRFWFEVSKETGITTPQYWELARQLGPVFLTLSIWVALLVGVGPLFIKIPIYFFEDSSIYPLIHDGLSFLAFSLVACYAILGIIAPLKVVKDVPAASANKLYWIAATLLMFFVEDLISIISTISSIIFDTSIDDAPWYEYFDIVISPIQPLCVLAFVFICLSKRIVSFNFFVNKTVVYVLTASALIFGFWALKSNIESLTSVDQDARKTMINAGVALLVFVAKQFKGFTDAALKKVLFSALGRRELELKKFMEQMEYFENARALRLEFVSRMSSFLHGGRVEIFDRTSRAYVGSETGKEIPVDDNLAVELRARKAPVFASTIAGQSVFRLLVPGAYRGSMVLFLGLYESQDLPTIRPDELRLLENALQRLVTQLAFLELDERRHEKISG
jgi:hypothetical protein